MTDLISTIQQIGLSESEARIYHTLLSFGEISISKLAKESKMSRANAYIIIKKLDFMGLVSHSKIGKREFISAVHPNRLRQIINLRRTRFEDDFEKMKTLYEEGHLNKPKIQIFEGMDSVKLVYMEILEKLKKKEQLSIFTNISAVQERVPQIPKEFEKIIGRYAYQTKVRELTYLDDKSYKYYEGIKAKISEKYQLRFADKKYDFGENEQFIMKDKLILFSLQERIFVIIIENQDLIKTHQAMFDMAWDQAQEPESLKQRLE